MGICRRRLSHLLFILCVGGPVPAILPVDQNGGVAAFASQDAGSTVHLLLDINGYFQ